MMNKQNSVITVLAIYLMLVVFLSKNKSTSLFYLAIYLILVVFFFKNKSTSLFYPVSSDFIISSPFGMRVHPVTGEYKMHNGIDFACPVGTPVYSVESGVVIVAAYDSTAGNYLKIEHENLVSKYLHLKDILVTEGETVSRGQLIAYSGDTGAVTGAHLHFAMQDLPSMEYVNPVDYL